MHTSPRPLKPPLAVRLTPCLSIPQGPIPSTKDINELPQAQWRQVRQALHHRRQHVSYQAANNTAFYLLVSWQDGGMTPLPPFFATLTCLWCAWLTLLCNAVRSCRTSWRGRRSGSSWCRRPSSSTPSCPRRYHIHIYRYIDILDMHVCIFILLLHIGTHKHTRGACMRVHIHEAG